jgi:hypothetical protein
MTSNEFVLWLKGFTEGVHEFNITPKQWDILKEKLAEVEDKVLILESKPSFPFGTPNTAPIQTLPHITPSPTYPHRPYEIYCGSGSSGTITTTPGVGSITIGNPPFGFGSTSTTYKYPSGSAWSYTTSNEKVF